MIYNALRWVLIKRTVSDGLDLCASQEPSGGRRVVCARHRWPYKKGIPVVNNDLHDRRRASRLIHVKPKSTLPASH